MVHQDHAPIYGHLLQVIMILAQILLSVLVLTLIHGLILFLLSSVIITSATLVIMMQDLLMGCIIQMSLCLMDRGVVLIVPAASSTLLHGFVRNYHNQPVTILRLGSVEMNLFPMKMWLFP